MNKVWTTDRHGTAHLVYICDTYLCIYSLFQLIYYLTHTYAVIVSFHVFICPHAGVGKHREWTQVTLVISVTQTGHICCLVRQTVGSKYRRMRTYCAGRAAVVGGNDPDQRVDRACDGAGVGLTHDRRRGCK
jgi:hypothetical protein